MAAQGGSLKGRYDSDVIEQIVRTEQAEQAKPAVDPYEKIKDYEFDKPEGTVLFSEVFWEPRDIPDIPLPMFKVEDWHEEARNHIPAVDKHWIWNRPVAERLALALSCGDTTLLHGLQGTGKTCIVEQWCATFNTPFWRMSCNRETREAHFLGSPSVEYNDEGQMYIKQEPTILTDSLKYGGVFCEDEAFRHNSALVLQSLREKSTRTVLLPDAPGRTASERKLVAPAGRWWYILTDNTCGSGDETGVFDAEVQDASTLDRVGVGIEVRYLSKPLERRILKEHTDLSEEIINQMLDFAKQVRVAFEAQQLLCTFSVRSLLAWAEKLEMTKSIELALTMTWYDKLCGDDKATVRDMFHQIFAKSLT
jgi:MoxR-like ATPase